MSARLILATIMAAGLSAVPGVANAQCNHCCETTKKSCCGIHYTKIVYKGSSFIGAPPPAGVAVASMPAMMVATPAFAVNPASLATIAPAPAPAQTAPATAPATTRDCPDPCAEIKQLRKDVDDLISVTNRLTEAVNVLSAEYKKNHP